MLESLAAILLPDALASLTTLVGIPRAALDAPNVDARRFRVCASDTVHGHARPVTA